MWELRRPKYTKNTQGISRPVATPQSFETAKWLNSSVRRPCHRLHKKGGPMPTVSWWHRAIAARCAISVFKFKLKIVARLNLKVLQVSNSSTLSTETLWARKINLSPSKLVAWTSLKQSYRRQMMTCRGLRMITTLLEEGSSRLLWVVRFHRLRHFKLWHSACNRCIVVTVRRTLLAIRK